MRGSNDSLEGAIGEADEDANNPLTKQKPAAAAAASSSVEPDFDEEAPSDTDSRRQTISESDAEGGSATDGALRSPASFSETVCPLHVWKISGLFVLENFLSC